MNGIYNFLTENSLQQAGELLQTAQCGETRYLITFLLIVILEQQNAAQFRRDALSKCYLLV